MEIEMARIPLPPKGGTKTTFTSLSEKIKAETTKPNPHQSENSAWSASSGSKSKNGQDTIYLIRVALQGGGRSGIACLAHNEQFKLPELEAQIAEAVKVVNEIRIPARRAEMASNQTPVPNLESMNLQAFQGDAEFFETVMVDKFGYRRQLTMNGVAEIIRTASSQVATATA
jgi:hypothetical protein